MNLIQFNSINISVNFKFIAFALPLLVLSTMSYSQEQRNPPPSSDFKYEDCGCSGQISLQIYNGLYGDYGGQLVTDAINVGAVTVANLNDTDGDGDTDMDGDIEIQDKDDLMVKNLTGAGRDEVDLMKLEITTTGKFPKMCSYVQITHSDGVKLWNKSTKEELTPLVFSLINLPITVYVEATKVSNSVRDINIKAVVTDLQGNSSTSAEVKATAIWVDKTNVYLARGTNPDPVNTLHIDNQDMLNTMTMIYDAVDLSIYGYGPLAEDSGPPFTGKQDYFHGGRILFEFTLLPSDIVNHLAALGIKYDCSRRIKRENKVLRYTAGVFDITSQGFPVINEQANDDGEMGPPNGPGDFLDEDAIPYPGFNEIFHYDNPSERRIGGPRAFSLRHLEFEEFVRVSFKNDVADNIVGGSMCSNKVRWKLDYGLTSTSHVGTDPHDGNWQVLEQSSGGISSSKPRRLIGSGTGKVTISNVGLSPANTYFLRMTSIDQWELIQYIGSTQTSLGFSNVSSLGPWFFNQPSFNVTINNDLTIGGTLFSLGETFAFNIWDVPVSNNTLISID